MFSGIERESKKKFVVPLVEPLNLTHDTDTLIPIMHKHILPGSVIITDGWAAYRTLKNRGYTHHVINHSENFVDPENPQVHTQNIERLCRGRGGAF